jgi:CheY-like chemotaxis protein
MTKTKPKTIMVVDDETALTELLEEVLKSHGFKVLIAHSGKECLEMLKKAKPDLILMDVMMPSMTGRETVEKIRENPKTKDLKIAYLTIVRYSGGDLKESKKLNIADYITKPFDSDELIFRINKMLEK